MFQDQLISAIKNGHYQLGDKLPSERELCARFQVSRVSVREAIAGLAAIGLVVIQRGKGAYVHSSPSYVYANQFEGYIKAHRVRELTKTQRTQTINQIRGLLSEYGVTLPVGKKGFRQGLAEALEDAENEMTDCIRELAGDLWERYKNLDATMTQYDRKIRALAHQIEPCRRLQTLDGVGPLTATAYYATIGDPHLFRNGRSVSAWLSLVPRQHASGARIERIARRRKIAGKHLRG